MAPDCAATVQTSIITEGFRSLAEGEQVEFFVESGDDGRTKAVQVTGPSGAPPQVLEVRRWPVNICKTCVRSVLLGGRSVPEVWGGGLKGVAIAWVVKLSSRLGASACACCIVAS